MLEGVELVVRILSILLSLCYVYQVLYIFLPLMRRKKPAHSPARPYRYAILIAARNEEAVLPYLLQSIRDQDYPKERITTYVVADNCTDGTAEALSDPAFKADVIERIAALHRIGDRKSVV